MPAVTKGKVLVSGANGYIAIWVVKALLDHGFSVRGTVRSESKATYLRSLFASFEHKFEIAIVEEITKDGAFDEAVKGVDAIAHIASPCHFNDDTELSKLIGPAVRGTTSILASALKHGPSVKRIVITSSCAAVLTPTTEPRIYSESNWNDDSINQVKKLGENAPGEVKYCASKTLAERAAWDFWNVHKAEAGWDLVVANPPFVYGPAIHQADGPENLGLSAQLWYDVVAKGTQIGAFINDGAGYVDVRDLAEGHVLTLTKPEAGGERIIMSLGPYKWQDFINLARPLSPAIPAGNTAYDPTKAVHLIQYVPDKGQRILGIKYRTMAETTKDTIDDFKARGWL